MRKRRNIIFFTVASVATLLLFVADLLLGSVPIGLAEIKNALFSSDPDPLVGDILLKFRLPKALVALVAGASLAASGLQMQTLFRNPLAGPFVLGVSSGASLGVALFLLGLPLLGTGAAGEVLRNLGMVGSAWIGAAAILFVVMAVSVRLKDIMAVLILGMMFGSAATAIVEILQFLSPEPALKSFVLWTMGSLGGVSSSQLTILLPVALTGLVMSILLIKPLNLLLLGENYAVTMGMRLKAVRAMIFLSTVLLAGTVTAFCGPIGFIGIAVPHVARMILSDADHRVLMPASMLLGSGLLIICDIISQLPGADMVVPVNTITALLGIPVVVMVIMRNRRIF